MMPVLLKGLSQNNINHLPTPKGKVWKFGDNVNTDEIIPAKYLVTFDAEKLGKHCLESVNPEFPKKVKKGDIIVAGENFGCGSSREHGPLAIKGAGISCVIARSFARIFFRNCINIGLPIIEQAEVSGFCQEGDILKIDLKERIVKNLSRKKEFVIDEFPQFLQMIIRKGGLMKWAKKNSK